MPYRDKRSQRGMCSEEKFRGSLAQALPGTAQDEGELGVKPMEFSVSDVVQSIAQQCDTLLCNAQAQSKSLIK